MTLEEAVDRVLASDRVLLGVDFDGTLAPIVEHPDDAVSDERALGLLRSIAARPAIEVAIVSGRGLADLRARLGEIPGATFVGEHGNDVEGVAAKPDPVLREAISLIDGLAELFPRATVEKKRQSVTFHTRTLDEAGKKVVGEAVHHWIADRRDITLIEGKEVFELTTASGNKGDAIRNLAREAPIIYLGDDTTDETVFEILGSRDVGVKVGEGDSAAGYRVEDIDGVVAILEQIALASR